MNVPTKIDEHQKELLTPKEIAKIEKLKNMGEDSFIASKPVTVTISSERLPYNPGNGSSTANWPQLTFSCIPRPDGAMPIDSHGGIEGETTLEGDEKAKFCYDTKKGEGFAGKLEDEEQEYNLIPRIFAPRCAAAPGVCR